MSLYERQPCPGLNGRDCVGTGVSRSPRPCGACRSVCDCGQPKSETAATCLACYVRPVAPKVWTCQLCGGPKKTGLGQWCSGCARKQASPVKSAPEMDADHRIPHERRDHADPEARYLALQMGGSL